MSTEDESNTIFKIKLAKWFYHILAIAGLLLFVLWQGATMVFAGRFTIDVGLYAVTVLLVGAGIVGSLLYRELEKEAMAEQGSA